jgi:hypothetical protein
MNLPDMSVVFRVILLLVALAFGWVIFRMALKVTAKLFAVGCFALLALGIIGFFAGWLG